MATEMLPCAMEFLSPYFPLVTILFVSVCFLHLAFRTRSSTDTCSPLPPGKTGWPIIGESIEFHKASRVEFHMASCEVCPERYFSERASKCSPYVFRTSLLGEDLAVFCGAQGNKFLLSGDNNYVKTWISSSLTKVLGFPETCRACQSWMPRRYGVIFRISSSRTP
ncbi:hypothetical protein MLD38_013091 [Melastoma candidum]|uniref:Uncharacterized protein n=1 Tax=Melastoma candidum TaxID=119954 RepID=A0ACB9RGV9_9MYRT|nr:hypothetical protein MLD38_013091 [Melastoma candidum]